MNSNSKYIIALIVFLLALPCCTIASEKPDDDPQANHVLDFQAELLFKGQTTKKSLPVRITFRNVSPESLRLLRVFKPATTFFDVSLLTLNHEEIPIAKPIISTDQQQKFKRENSWKYLTLESNELFSTVIDIGEFIPSGLPEGTYYVLLTYRNEYGAHCVKGAIQSDRIWFDLIDEAVEHIEGSISEEKAIELAKAAVEKSIIIQPMERISVRNTAKRFIITFESPTLRSFPASKNAIPFRVYLDRMTGVVEIVVALYEW